MTIKATMFVCACPKHGLDTHDGSKNECCDAAVILPVLNTEEMAKLVPEGKKQYEADMLMLANLVEGGAVSLASNNLVETWYKEVGFPLVEEQWENQPEEAAEETDESFKEVAEVSDFNPDAYYMAGFEAGFAQGFGKGWDSGSQLNMVKMANGKR